MKLRQWGFVVAALAVAVGCGKKADEAKAGDKGEAPAAAPADTALTAINAAVPADLKSTLTFAMTDDPRGRLTVAAPVGWDKGIMPGSWKPPASANLGDTTRFSASTNCDGACEKKEWAPIVDKVEFDRQIELGGQVTVDDKKDGFRLVVIKRGNLATVAAAWWKPDGTHYFYCRALLAGRAVEAVDAFEKACRSLAPKHW